MYESYESLSLLLFTMQSYGGNWLQPNSAALFSPTCCDRGGQLYCAKIDVFRLSSKHFGEYLQILRF